MLVNLEILPPRKYETEKAKRFLGDGLEWAEVHNRVDILGIEVRPCGNGIKASDDEFNGVRRIRWREN